MNTSALLHKTKTTTTSSVYLKNKNCKSKTL